MGQGFGGKPKTVVDRKVFISDSNLEDEYTKAFGGPEAARALIDGGFCREQAILQAARLAAISEIGPEAVAKFCRDKGKVDAATAISEALTPDTAKEIGSVARLLWLRAI